ncbi:MAG: ribosome maturation factor RimM [Burkholderiaceae bacterium]|nr:MAG: ribosome maturation factor RimM [Burkholderiaceae bacterium]
MSNPNDLEWPSDAIEVGRIVDAWGIKGGFKVQPYAADPQALFATRQWFILPPEGKPLKPGATFPKSLKVRQPKPHGDVVTAMADEVPDRNAAEAIKGARVFVSRAHFPAAEDGEYYWIDLLGLSVVNQQGEVLGIVDDLMDNGVQSILRVGHDTTDAKGEAVRGERLIPFVDAFVLNVDLAARQITVDWGLDY